MKIVNKSIVKYHLGDKGRVFGSKGLYSHTNPRNIVIFNSNIYSPKSEKLWYGDIDITKEIGVLKELSKDLGFPIYVLYEMAGRFENEDKPLLDKFVVKVNFDNVIFKEGYPVKKSFGKYVLKKVKYKKPKYDKKEYNQDDYIEVKLEKSVFNIDKSVNPINKFYSSFLEKYVDKNKKLSVSDIFISDKLNDKLFKLYKKWLIKCQGLGKKSYSLKKELAWVTLDLPNIFTPKPKWAKKYNVYIKKEGLDNG